MKKRLIGLALLLVAAVALAQTYNKFGPVNGVLKGTTTTYQTSAAASSDIITLWSGSCSSSTFLRGDGACAAGNAGTVTSITAGTGLTGGTITTTGTIALSTPVTATNGGTGEAGTITGVLKGNASSAFTAAAAADVYGLWSSCTSSKFLNGAGSCTTVDLTSEVANALGAANGGSGEAGTITGLLKGNGTSAYTAGASSDVTALFSGTCNSSSFLRGDGACATVSASPGGSTTQIQYNNAGAFAGSSSFTWTNSSHLLTILAGGGAGSIFSIAGNNGGFQSGDVELASSSAQVGSLINYASATQQFGTNGSVYLTIATNGGLVTSNNSGLATGGSQGAGTLNVNGGIFTNGTSIVPLTGTTGSIGGGALGAGACTSGTASVTSSTTSMAVIATPGTYPGDGTVWMGYVSSAGTVTVKVCSIAGNTPGATTYNVRVIP